MKRVLKIILGILPFLLIIISIGVRIANAYLRLSIMETLEDIDFSKIKVEGRTYVECTPQFDDKTKAYIDTAFTCYEFEHCRLCVPNTMELRKEGSQIAKISQQPRNNFTKIYKIDLPDISCTFQPKGSNTKNLKEQQRASGLSARIQIVYGKDWPLDLCVYDGYVNYTDETYNELNEASKDLIKLNEGIICVDDISIGKNCHKYVYLKQRYLLAGLEGNVEVVDYFIQNAPEMVKLTLSFRSSEYKLWESDFEKVINTFEFVTPHKNTTVFPLNL